MFLKSRVKNTCVSALWPLKGVLVESRFYAYVCHTRSISPLRMTSCRADLSSLGMSWERLGRQILSLFTVSALSGVSLGMSWERLGKQILSLFVVSAPSGCRVACFGGRGLASRFCHYLR